MFEPVSRRRKPDVRGVLWIDPDSAELRTLDYAYVGGPTRVRSDSIGGRLEFQRLPSGRWIVREWFIRMPVVAMQESRGFPPQPPSERLIGYREEGGEATTLNVPARIIVPLFREMEITGMVYDSVRAAPLQGVRVTIDGTDQVATTDSGGAYRLELPARGTYVLRFSHPRLALLGLGEPTREIAAARTGVRVVEDVAIPGVPALRRIICDSTAGADTDGVLVGRVRDADGASVAELRVRATWQRFTRAAGGALGAREPGIEATVDSAGVFRICGLPLDQRVTVRAVRDKRSGDEVVVRFEEGGLVETELEQP